MSVTTLQVPVSKGLKKSATEVAKEYGFSSLQEVVRVLLTKLSRKELVVGIREETVVKLSKRAEERYAKMDEDYEKRKDWFVASGVDELLKNLNP